MFNRLKIGTKIGASFALGLGLFAVIAALSYQGTRQLIKASEWEAHTYKVIKSLQELSARLIDAETGQRGYVITGNPSYLEPYNNTQSTLGQEIKALRALTVDNPQQQQRLDTLEPLITIRMNRMQEVITIRQQQGLTAAQTLVQTDQGKQAMDNIRRILRDMETEELSLLSQRSRASSVAASNTLNSIAYGIPAYSALLLLIGFFISRNISKPLQTVADITDRVGHGDLDVSVPTSEREDEIGTLTRAFNRMVDRLRETSHRNEQQNWLKSNLAELTRLLQGQRDQASVAQQILSRLAALVNAQQGVFYLLDTESEPPQLKRLSSYAHLERKHVGNEFRLGEGLVGQCALEKQPILLTDVPDDYIRIRSGLGDITPLNIIVQPILFEQQVAGVIELASLQRFTEIQLTLLQEVSEGIGVVLSTIAADMRTAQLLKQSQALTEELQRQQDELQESNRLLEEQTEALQASEALLKEQQEELQQTNEELQQLNEELEEKAQLLSEQKQEVERKNREIDQTRRTIEEKAQQLELSSRYKSEFLANMSHELRTPLNSLLILARLLSENSEGNLTAKQVEYSRTIHSAGTDLLELINEILDLAKIESGTTTLEIESLAFSELQNFLERTFQEVAQAKGLTFQVAADPQLPATLSTDAKRLQQVLKNLLANAFKFTEQGGVTLRITPIAAAQAGAPPLIAFAVTDTGIGIPADKQALIFEAFQQADGTTSRKYGGTGLGLSISRELAHLLGGHIELVSTPGMGSTFTLVLPRECQPNVQSTPDATPQLPPRTAALPTAAPPLLPTNDGRLFTDTDRDLANDIEDDRDQIQPGDRVLLIIEDDTNFVRILMDMAQQQGFKVLVALRSQSGLALARTFKPDAIMLDIRLPDMDGWTVLDQLKHDPETRHIPVHILSVDDGQQRSFQLGAIAYLQKPVTPEALTQALQDIKGFIERQVKNLLVIEDDAIQAESIRELIGEGDVQTTIVSTAAAAMVALRSRSFDCVVMDLGLPDMPGFDLIEQIKQEPEFARLPIIVYTGRELTASQETRLKRLAETIIIKDVRSPARLLDETALFLHRVQARLPQAQQQILEELHQNDPILAHKKVLIVDDDVRNIFALTSLLEQYQMQVLYAENGADGITLLQSHPDVSAVLMDVMMPGMDGYETTRAIRQQEPFRTLPIIALTAKAMQGDREKCLEAGASDYITKPVDTEQLLSLLRVWLYP